MDENQIRKILSKVRELNVVIDNELATKALEIKDLAASAENKKLLERLRSSLEQYIAKEQNLVYVGFVGHFSSGKSSTINSILKVSGTPDERHTDLNPTDTAITLITDKVNSHKLIHMTKESTYVPVRTVFMESAFLTDLVIADTPGSGDPNIVNELIQDFLPICDYILYFISAANPIDLADIPLLSQKHLKLPFIPLKFVVTRSDEFRSDPEQRLSDVNMNASKRDGFIGQLISRLKEFADAGEITEEDFIFIDNRDKYNIEELSSKISSWSSELDQHALWNNHSHKLEFYSRNFDDLESYFLNTIKTKIRITGDFLRTAGENIHKFDAAVEVNNEKLRNVWLESDRKLMKALLSETEQTDQLMKLTIPRTLSNTFEMAQEQKLISTFIENQSNGNIGRFTSELYQQIRSRILVMKQDIANAIANSDIVVEDIRTLLPPRIDLSSIEETLELDFTKMDNQVIAYINRLYLLADSHRSALILKLDTFLTLMDQRQVVNSLDNVYQHGADTISENFDKYFDVIEMYKASVLTKNTKDTIQKLRIGKQLDDLDDEFPEQYKQTKKEEAISVIYPKKEDKISELRLAVHEIEDHILALKRQLSSNPIKRDPTINNFFQKAEFKITDIMDEVRMSIEAEVNRVYQEKLLNVFEDHRAEFLTFKELKDKQKRNRGIAIFKWSAVATLLAGGGYLMMLKLDMIAPTTVAWTFIFGLATSALGTVLGYIAGMFRNDLAKSLARHTLVFREKSSQQLRLAFNEDFFNGLSLSVNEARPKKLPSLEKKYFEKLSAVTNPAVIENDRILSGLIGSNAILTREVTKYVQLITDFQNLFKGIFSNLDENSLKIRTITHQIKQKSIQPSFALLENTQLDLERVKNQIESILVRSEEVGTSAVE